MSQADAFDRIATLRSSTRKLFEEYTQVESQGAPQLLKKLLLALELRWKLEELVLLPALQGTQGVTYDCTQDAAHELDALRDLVALAGASGLNVERQRLLLGAVETLAALRTERISWALTQAQRAALVDARALGREMDQLLERWHTEVRRTGDVEDEEQDPVGQPPR
jgi:hypothetical protein